MNINIKIAQHILDVDAAWDAFLPERHHLKSKHLLAFENSQVEDIETYYVQVFAKDKLIGLVYLQQFQFQNKHLNFNKDQQLLSKLIKIILPKQLPILVCGHLFRIDFQGFYFKNPSHKAHVFAALKLFTNEHKVCKPRGIIIKDCEEVFVEQHCHLFSYQFFNGDVTMELSRREKWLRFEDYLNDLNKKYLQRAKKIIKSFEGVEKREFIAQDILENAKEINQLYFNVVEKQTVKLGIVNTQYFYELKNNLEQNFEFHALYASDKMIGFYTFIFYETEMETHFIGLDYEANQRFQTYFNILFLAAEKMIERTLNKLELGRTAREAKANLGALPKQIFNYIHVRNPIVKLTLNHFLKSFNRKENASLVNRTPLK